MMVRILASQHFIHLGVKTGALQIFNVTMAEIESVVKPYGVLDDF
jgi:hypothetical protein